MTPSPFTFAPQAYPGGRILLMLGAHQAGAIFPPCGAAKWVWRFWLGSSCPDRFAQVQRT